MHTRNQVQYNTVQTSPLPASMRRCPSGRAVMPEGLILTVRCLSRQAIRLFESIHGHLRHEHRYGHLIMISTSQQDRTYQATIEKAVRGVWGARVGGECS